MLNTGCCINVRFHRNQLYFNNDVMIISSRFTDFPSEYFRPWIFVRPADYNNNMWRISYCIHCIFCGHWRWQYKSRDRYDDITSLSAFVKLDVVQWKCRQFRVTATPSDRTDKSQRSHSNRLNKMPPWSIPVFCDKRLLLLVVRAHSQRYHHCNHSSSRRNFSYWYNSKLWLGFSLRADVINYLFFMVFNKIYSTKWIFS